jgi:Recombination endonuclease VII
VICINLIDADAEREERRKAANRRRSANYRARHPEAVARYQQTYRDGHREERKAKGRIRDRRREMTPERKAQRLMRDRARRADPAVKARLNEISRQFYERNPEYRRDRLLWHFYGMTAAEYDALLASQGGGCAVCGTAENTTKGRRLPVDHDHDTGKVRGVLCSACNSSLGYAGDSSERLLLLAAYLKRHGK